MKKMVIILLSIVLFLIIITGITIYAPHIGSILITATLLILFTFITIKLVKHYKIYAKCKKTIQKICYIFLIVVILICISIQVLLLVLTSIDLIKGPQKVILYNAHITLKTERKYRGRIGKYYKVVGTTANGEEKVIGIRDYKDIKIEDAEKIIKEKHKNKDDEFTVYYYENLNLVYSIE